MPRSSGGVVLIDRKGMLIEDPIRAERPVEVWSFLLHTPAVITLRVSPEHAKREMGNVG